MISPNSAVTQAAGEAARELFDEGIAKSADYADDGSSINVGSTERNISIAVGTVVGLLGLTKPLSLRGLVMMGLGGALIYRGMSGNCPLYSKLGVSTREGESREPSAEPSEYFNRAIHVEESVTIAKPASELYTYWRNFENLPRIMDHLKEVQVLSAKRSRWVAKAPLGYSVEWEAEIINDEPNAVIAWRSIGDAMVDNSGSVRFIEAGEGKTEVRVVIDYIPPAGRVGSIIARFFGEEPQVQVREDLGRFKELMETGEVAAGADGRSRNA